MRVRAQPCTHLFTMTVFSYAHWQFEDKYVIQCKFNLQAQASSKMGRRPSRADTSIRYRKSTIIEKGLFFVMSDVLYGIRSTRTNVITCIVEQIERHASDSPTHCVPQCMRICQPCGSSARACQKLQKNATEAARVYD